MPCTHYLCTDQEQFVGQIGSKHGGCALLTIPESQTVTVWSNSSHALSKWALRSTVHTNKLTNNVFGYQKGVLSTDSVIWWPDKKTNTSAELIESERTMYLQAFLMSQFDDTCLHLLPLSRELCRDSNSGSASYTLCISTASIKVRRISSKTTTKLPLPLLYGPSRVTAIETQD